MRDPSQYAPLSAGAGANTDGTPRNKLLLRDVAYLIEAHPVNVSTVHPLAAVSSRTFPCQTRKRSRSRSLRISAACCTTSSSFGRATMPSSSMLDWKAASWTRNLNQSFPMRTVERRFSSAHTSASQLRRTQSRRRTKRCCVGTEEITTRALRYLALSGRGPEAAATFVHATTRLKVNEGWVSIRRTI